MDKKIIFLAAVLMLSSCTAGNAANANTTVTEQTSAADTAAVSVSETEGTAENETSSEIILSSGDLYDGYWDVKISHDKGQDISPEVIWDSVPGASCYAVYIIDPDGGNWIHMKAVTAEPGLSSGEIRTKKDAGEDDKGIYIGPYPPRGVHTYDVHVFALAENTEYDKLPGGNVDGVLSVWGADKLISRMQEEYTVLAYGKLSGQYPGTADGK